MDMAQGFHTKDTDMASYLYASGVALLGVDRSDPQNVEFVFSPPDEKLLTAFRTSAAMVNALAFCAARKYLLNRIHRD